MERLGLYFKILPTSEPSGSHLGVLDTDLWKQVGRSKSGDSGESGESGESEESGESSESQTCRATAPA